MDENLAGLDFSGKPLICFTEMPPAVNLLAILSLLGAAQGVLLALALMSVKRGNKIANRLLAALTAVVSIFVFGAVIRTTSYDFIYPHLSRIHDPFTFLAGPLLYLYLRTLLKKAVIQAKDLLHFLPFAVCVFYLIPYYFQSAADKSAALLAEYQNPGLGEWYYVRSALIIAHVFIYLSLTIWAVYAVWRKARADNSAIDQAVLIQIRYLIISGLALWIIAFLRFTLDETAQTNLLVPLGASIMVYGLGYIGLRKSAAFTGTEEILPAPKYSNSNLTADRSERYLKKLIELMETEKPYIDSELNLQKLAARLSIPPHYLSQTINERLNLSFSEFVNNYRIEEFKRLLREPQSKHLSILAIAENAGFSSKSSFNAVFKKHTNMTPSDFRRAANGGGNGKH